MKFFPPAVRVAVMAAAVMAAAGCAGKTAAPTAPAPVVDPAQSARAKLVRWELQGKLGVRTDDRGGAASLLWRRDGARHHIELFGPFGSNRVVIKQDNHSAALRDGANQTWRAKTAREVLFQSAGWHVPFEELTRWVVGLPAGGDGEGENETRDAAGNLSMLREAGWTVRYLAWDDAQNEFNLALPRTVYLSASPLVTAGLVHEKSGRPVERLEVRLALKRWRRLAGGLRLAAP
ncbi:MAG: lipoprotein insertase outer membrane protein LolB [Gammaproteobacteria bacterium]|nr:lipoprotein insertase outer membrane protein LolB [Gammaproteobacteria bacterium]